MIVAGKRPRSLTWCPRCLAHALISALRSRPGPVRALRRRPVARRAGRRWVKGNQLPATEPAVQLGLGVGRMPLAIRRRRPGQDGPAGWTAPAAQALAVT